MDVAAGVASQDRLQWLDATRGLGIVLVVYAHGGRALFDVLPHLEVFRQIDRVIYAFHMPLFFLLAGLVSAAPLARSRTRFLRGKLVTVVYPYFLWSLLYWSLETIFRDRVNSPLEEGSILRILWSPIEHLWFLYVLFLCQVFAAAVWPRALILVLACGWFFFGPLPAITVPALWTQLPWFTAGLLLAPVALTPGVNAVRQAGFAVGIAVACAVGALLFSSLSPAARVVDFLTAGVGISLTVALATAVRGNRLIAYLGQASLSIYLMHTIFSAGVREFLEVVYPIDPLALLAITVMAGLVLPLVVHEFARRTGATPFLGLGKMSPASIGDARSERPLAT